MIYFIADTHFGHRNIVLYCGRPFKDEVDMDETIKSNWNSVVSQQDTVFHLGDFSLHYPHDRKKQLLDSLNGKKILIIGNHDIDRVGHWAKMGIMAHKKPIVYEGLILSHEPEYFPELPNVHGHTHGNTHRGEISEHGIHICVSVEAIGYKPVALEWIQQEIVKRRAI